MVGLRTCAWSGGHAVGLVDSWLVWCTCSGSGGHTSDLMIMWQVLQVCWPCRGSDGHVGGLMQMIWWTCSNSDKLLTNLTKPNRSCGLVEGMKSI